MLKELEILRKDLAEKAPKEDLHETKTNFGGQLEEKVSLLEVQNALNDCQ